MPRGNKAQKEAKRAIVARGVAAGKSTAKIAQEAGCGPRHVQRLAAELDTRVLVSELMRPHRRRLAASIPKALEAIDRALNAKKVTKHDHLAQLRGVERLQEYLELAQGGSAASESGDDAGAMVTWEQFLVLYERRTEATS